MPSNEPLEIISLGQAHLADALALSESANWNQVSADWRMMMSAGKPIGIEAPGRGLVASALTLAYGEEFGWISMVLVAPDWRKKGLATRLLRSCIDTLEKEGLVPVLDATPAGENVYRPMGFEPIFQFQRWWHAAVETIDLRPQLGTQSVSTAAILSRDRQAFGGDRRIVINDLVGRGMAFMQGTQEGFLLGRDGRVASQIGPIVADSECQATVMLDRALSRLSGPVMIDASDHHPGFIRHLQAYGFESQRPFLRMTKGKPEGFGIQSQMFAMAGPELG